MRPLLIAALLSTALAAPALAQSSPTGTQHVDPTLAPLRAARTFTEELAIAYESFASPFAERAPEASAAFQAKAEQARGGVAFAPIDPASLEIDDADAAAALLAGHATLLQVLNGGAAVYLPDAAANAQNKYDCWATALGAGAMAAGATCQSFFEAEIGRIRDILGFRDDLRMKGIVLFEFGEAGLNEWSDPVLDSIFAVLAEARPEAVVVVGRTDTVGSTQTNVELSERRAVTIERALEARGGDPEVVRVELIPLGQDAPVVETGDEVRLVWNRQVAVWAGTGAEVDAALATLTN